MQKAPALVDLSAFENPADERLSIFSLDGKNVGIWLMACPEDTDYRFAKKCIYICMHQVDIRFVGTFVTRCHDAMNNIQNAKIFMLV